MPDDSGVGEKGDKERVVVAAEVPVSKKPKPLSWSAVADFQQQLKKQHQH